MKAKSNKPKKRLTNKSFLASVIDGIGWSLGATVGFGLLIAILSYVLKLLGGIPLIGKFFGGIIESTQGYLSSNIN